MDELKILIESVAKLPNLAIWVVAIYFVFKVIVVGSIYGVIRYVVMKITETIQKKKVTVVEQVTKIEEITVTLESQIITTDDTAKEFLQLVKRMKSTSYIHDKDVQWVQNALDNYEKQYGKSRYTLHEYVKKEL